MRLLLPVSLTLLILPLGGTFLRAAAPGVPRATGALPADPPIIKAWRTSGRFTYVWSDRWRWSKDVKFTLNGRIPLEIRHWIPYGSHSSLALHVPEDVPAGAYVIQPGGIPFEVTAKAPAREEVKVADGDVAALRAAVAAGKDVRLAPGEYILTEPLQLSAGGTIRGTSRDAVRMVGMGDVVFVPAPGAVLRQLTIEAAKSHLHGGDWAQGELTDCRLINGHWGEGKREGLLVRNVIFERCGAMQVTDRVLFLRCRFEGVNSQAGHAWSTWGARNIVMLESEFDGTDRGLIIQGARGRVEDCLFDHVSFRNINRTENGNELVLFETVDARNNLFSRLRFNNCATDGILIWESDATGNVFSDFMADGMGGIRVWSSKPRTVSGNTFRFGELRGGYVDLGRYGRSNRLDHVALVSPRPSRNNQVEIFSRGFYAPRSVIYAHRSNVVNDCVVVDALKDWESITLWGEEKP